MSSSPKPVPAWNDWEGQMVAGEFPLLRFLGSSERSAVFLTQRAKERHKAAIKLIPADVATAEYFLTRWRRAAQLSHPNLLRLFEAGRDELNGIPFAYVVLEHAEENLSQVDRPLTDEEARDLLGTAVGALTYLREQGLAHGHLRPSNILANDNRLMLSIDSARPSGEWRGELEAAGAYSAPEIARDGATPAGDVWSLGMTLAEAITRRMPTWDAGAAQASVAGALPDSLREALSKCLLCDPRQRATDGDLAYFLRVSAVAPSRVASPSGSGKRARWYILAAAVAGLAVAAALYLPDRGSESAVAEEPVAEPVAEPAPAPATPPPVAKAPVRVEPPPPPVRPPEQPVQTQPVAQPQRPDPPKVQPVAKAEPLKASPAKAEPEPVAAAATSRPEPRILSQVLPDVPAPARDTIRGKVIIRVRLFVDSAGSVVDVSNQTPNASQFFSDLALQAARQWKFAPADANGPQSNAWTLTFDFRRDAKRPVTVQATAALR